MEFLLFSCKHLCTVAFGIRSVSSLISITFRGNSATSVIFKMCESIQNVFQCQIEVFKIKARVNYFS